MKENAASVYLVDVENIGEGAEDSLVFLEAFQHGQHVVPRLSNTKHIDT